MYSVISNVVGVFRMEAKLYPCALEELEEDVKYRK